MGVDGRIAVRLATPGAAIRGSSSAVLIRIGAEPAAWQAEGDGDASGWATVLFLPGTSIAVHSAACRCCSGRSGVSDALGLLFARRARAELPFFTRVVVQGEPGLLHDLVTILCKDDTLTARFRLES